MLKSLFTSMRLSNVAWLGLSLVAIVLDQWTKGIATATLNFGEANPVFPGLDWTLLYNTGAAFSFLSDAGGWQRYLFTGMAMLVSVIFVIWLLRLPKDAKVLAAGIALVLGGAVGNLIDRMTLGHVVDFISVYYDSHYFPAFNIADSAITVGTILLIIDMLFLDKIRQAKSEISNKPASEE